MQKKLSLKFIHIFVSSLLVIMALFFIGTQKPYIKEIEAAELDHPAFSFLQEGQYILDITYENGTGNRIIVYSKAISAPESDMAYTELAEYEIIEENGTVQILLDLEQGTHSVELAFENSERNLATEPGTFCRIQIQSVALENHDGYFLSALYIACAAIILLCGWTGTLRRYDRILLLAGIGLAASVPLFSDNLCKGDDLLYHITRLEGIYQGLQNGEFPVRINPLQSGGYGNLSPTMYPSLFLYPVAILRFFGVSAMLCYKVLLTAMNIATAFLSFYAVRAITGSEKSAWLMSVLYTFATYRLTNLYYRAALGESLAMVFLPLLLWGTYEIFYGQEKKWFLMVLGVTGVLESHVLSFEMCLIFLGIEGILWLIHSIAIKRENIKSRIMALLKAVFGTLCLNAAFLVPFLYYAGQDFQAFHMPMEVAGSGVYLTQMFQLFSPADGTNLLQGTAQGEMSLSVGLTLLAGVLIFLVQLVTDDAENVAARMGKHCLCYGVLCLLLASWICPWDKLQELPVFSVLAQSLQFAWRFLSPATLFLCAVSSVSVVWLEKKSNRFTVYGVILSLVIVSTCYYFDRITHDMAQSDDKMWLEGQQYSDGMYMYWEGNKFRALQLNYQSEDNAIKTAKGSAISYRNLDRQGNRLRFFLEQCGDADDYLVFPIYYYPGYEVRINGKITEGQVIDTRVACNMPQQPAEVMIRYKERPLFVAADLVSLFTVAAILWKKCLLIFHVAKKP